MAKKSYEPHPRLTTKVVPAETEYDRQNSRAIVRGELEALEAEFENDLQAAEEYYDSKGDLTTAEEMYENGFHIETPEN